MHIVHVVRDLDVASGGPSRSVPALAEHQSRQPGVKVTVFYRDRGRPVVELPHGAVKYQTVAFGDFALGKFLRGFPGSSSREAGKCVFHLHGLWSPTLHRAASFARKHRVPYVVSTRGMLARWAFAHKSLRKRIAWGLYQERDLKAAAYLLASSEFEQQDVISHLPLGKVLVIPNGCSRRPEGIVLKLILPQAEAERWALAMGRLPPGKRLR